MSTTDLDYLVVGNSSEDPFAIDVAHAMGQREDIADLISMKRFANTEFCPRFISDDQGCKPVGYKLENKTVIVVSTNSQAMSRQSQAMRNMLIARAAKENGAAQVILVEPDLFYSAQDRGARKDLGYAQTERDEADLKKFDGQPFTAKLYAEMLKLAGVDRVVTVHNHSYSVQTVFKEVFHGNFHNLIPYDIFVDYLTYSDIVTFGPDGEGLALCAPDQGAREFVQEMYQRLNLPKAKFIMLDKERTSEHSVKIRLHRDSPDSYETIYNHDVVLFDDMVRTGSTVIQSCQYLKEGNPGRTVFALSHFYASDEGRSKMANSALDEILTLNTLPTILNRDIQGRLRKKMVVLKIESWLAQNLRRIMQLPPIEAKSFYQIDMSSKNQRWTQKIYSNDQLKTLKKKRQAPQI